MRVLVIIVTFNGKIWIHKCIESIFLSKILADIYIIDNGSTDGTQEYIKDRYKDIIFYQSSENLGFGKANNIGLQYAIDNNYDYVYLLNQDAWLLPETIETLINIHKKYPVYGILSPIQLQANMLHMDKNFGSLVCSYTSNNNILEDLYFNRKSDVYPVPFVMAAHWLISRDCLKKVGGFSPTFSQYGEDNNYIERTLYHGYKVGIVLNSIAVHDREYRTDSKRKIIHLIHADNLLFCSKLDKTHIEKVIYIFKTSLKAFLKYKSILPVRNLFIILFAWNNIISRVNISKSKTRAFLP